MWLSVLSLWLHSSYYHTTVSNLNSSVNWPRSMGLPAGSKTCPSLSDWICPMYTNADGNLQNPLVREYAMLRSCATCVFLLNVPFLPSFLWDTNPAWQYAMDPKICITSPCSYSPILTFTPTLNEAVVVRGSLILKCRSPLIFQYNPNGARSAKSAPPSLLCRDCRCGKISYQKFKYRSTPLWLKA